jgi:peptidoglycan/LPS O-acetylase OafA/YrhL
MKVETAARTGRIEYMPQLDSLRAFAVMAVVISHYTPYGGGSGNFGVRLFFVLSGFLITRILLDARSALDTRQSTAGHEMRVFFSRRALRLYPPLIIVIGLGTLSGVESLRSTWWWHITYLSNVYFAIRRDWEGALTPLWSLSVEEQFYLVWPAVILFVPYRRLGATIAGVIASALLFNALAYAMHMHWMAAHVLPFHAFDAFGLGALLAVSASRPGLSPVSEKSLGQFALPVGIIGVIGLAVLVRIGQAPSLNAILKDPFASLLSVGIVAAASRGISGPVGDVLNLAWVRFVGRISYGIYLYHNFVQDMLYGLWKSLGVPLENGYPEWLVEFSRSVAGPHYTKMYKLIIVTVQIGVVIGLASLSWFAVERPLRALRRRIGRRSASSLPHVNFGPGSGGFEPAHLSPQTGGGDDTK